MLSAATGTQGLEGRNAFRLSGATLLLTALTVPASWLALNCGLLPVRVANLQQAAWLLVFSPVLEEFVFRSILQRNLTDYFARRCSENRAPFLAALISAGIFALCHGYRVGPQWMALWIVPGWALAEIWRRERSVWICMAAHACFNGSFLIMGLP